MLLSYLVIGVLDLFLNMDAKRAFGKHAFKTANKKQTSPFLI